MRFGGFGAERRLHGRDTLTESIMDQATTLREMTRQGRQPEGRRRRESGTPHAVRVMAVTSGKGGVGKTNVVANLAYAFTKLGQRVLVMDADLSLGNLDVLLGLTPHHTLGDVLSGRKTLREVITRGPGGMMILPATSGVQELTALTEAQRVALLDAMDALEEKVDTMLIDTAAGVSSNVIYFALAAQEIVVVVSSEPTSLTDAYALMKILSTRYGEHHFKLLVNGVQKPEEGLEVYRNLSRVADRFLNISMDYLGHIVHDTHVPQAVCQQKAVLEIFPYAPASRCFLELAQTLLAAPPRRQPKGNIQFFWRRLVERT